MAYETKVILRSLANQVVLARSKKQIFEMIRSMAQVEGLVIPIYEDLKTELGVTDEENEK